MLTHFRKHIALIAGTGLLVLAAATSGFGQAAADGGTDGVVRISDRGAAAQQSGSQGGMTYQPGCAVPGQPGCAPTGQPSCAMPGQQYQACEGYPVEGCESFEGFPGEVVHEGHGCHLTGNPVIDWCTVHKMKMDAAVVCQWYNLKAKCCGCRHHGDDCDDDCDGKGHRHRCKICHRYHKGKCKGGHNGNCNGNCNGGYYGGYEGACNGEGSGCNGDCNGDCDGNRCSHGCCLCGYCGMGTPLVDCYSMAYPTLPQYADARDGKVYSAEGYNVPIAVPLAPNVGYTMNYGWGIPSSRLTPVSRFINEQGVVPPPQYGR